MSQASRYLIGAHVLGGRYDRAPVVGEAAPEGDDELAARAAVEIETALAQQMTSEPNADGGRTVDGGGRPGSFAPPPAPALAARDVPALPPARTLLRSELDDVADDEWTQWVTAMKVADPTTVADNGALGMFAMKPRRLEDLGLMTNVAPSTRKKGAMGWQGEWIAPMTQDAFLGNASIQYRVLAASTKLYADAIAAGDLVAPDCDEEITLSGALALLHRCGPRGLEQWADATKRLPATLELFQRTNGVF